MINVMNGKAYMNVIIKDKISRKALLKALNKWDISKLCLADDFKQLVKEQPEAYNIDEVKRQLLIESYDDGHGFSITLDKAEEIVEAEANLKELEGMK